MGCRLIIAVHCGIDGVHFTTSTMVWDTTQNGCYGGQLRITILMSLGAVGCTNNEFCSIDLKFLFYCAIPSQGQTKMSELPENVRISLPCLVHKQCMAKL